MKRLRMAFFAPLILSVACGLILAALFAVRQNNAPISQVLPISRRPILVLIPGVELNDLRDAHNAPALAHLLETCPAAVFPIAPPLRPPQSQQISPDARLALARDRLGVSGKNPAQAGQVIVLDAVFRAEINAPLSLPESAQEARQDALRRVDAAAADLARRDTDVFFVSPLPASGRGAAERVGWVLCKPGQTMQTTQRPAGLLTAPSTRHTPGLIAFADIGTTVYGTDATGGRVVETIAVQKPPAFLWTQTEKWTRQWEKTRPLVAVPWLLSGLLLAAFWLRDTRPRRSALCAYLACALPPALWAAALLPLLAGETSGIVTFYALAALLAVGAACVFAWRNANPARVLQITAGVTACLFAVDITLGGPLLGHSPLSFSPLEGARFYGAGNESAGIFLGASLVFALLCSPQKILWARGAVALIVVLLLGLPVFGANAGATIAALVGWGTLLVCQAPAPRRKQAAAFVVACAALLLTALLLGEARRPPSAQTHIGQALTRTGRGTNGDGGSAIQIARRKVAMNAHLAVSSPWAILLFAEIVLCAATFRKRHTKQRPWHGGALPLFAGAAAAFVFNDSGVVMAAACLLYAPPFLLFTLAKTPLITPRPSAQP